MNATSLTGTDACRCVHVFQHDRHSMHPKASIRRPGRIEAWFGQRTLQPPDLKEQLAFPRREQKQLGPLKVSPMGLGTWAWGNQFLWGYETDQDAELQEVFNLMVSKGAFQRALCMRTNCSQSPVQCPRPRCFYAYWPVGCRGPAALCCTMHDAHSQCCSAQKLPYQAATC